MGNNYAFYYKEKSLIGKLIDSFGKPFMLRRSGVANLQKGIPNGKNTSQNNDGFSIYDPSYTRTVNDPAGLNNYSLTNLDMVQRNSSTFFFNTYRLPW